MNISVIIPFYNLESYVDQCLDSVVAAFLSVSGSRDVEVEMVCVDDGSMDSTWRRLEEYVLRIKNQNVAGLSIRLIHKENGGEGSARNTGIRVSSGEWVTFLDGDDVWLENHLETAMPLLKRYADAEIIALKYADFADGAVFPAQTGAQEKLFKTDQSVPSEILLEVGVFPTFFRRSFAVTDVFSDLPLGADRLYMARCFARASAVVKCNAVVHGYRVRAGSMARAVWNARKVMSQCDYSYGSLSVLAGSGKMIGRAGRAYLASLWLSDVPNRLARLSRRERRRAWEHWRNTLDSECVSADVRYERIRRLLELCSFSMTVSIAMARFFRKVGVS